MCSWEKYGKNFSWYDNEWGFSNRMCDLVKYIHKFNSFMKNVLNKNLDLEGKKVLLRVDLNVPMKNGAITETSRIEKIIPTIKLLLEKQAK